MVLVIFYHSGYSQRGQSILSIANNTVKDINDLSGNHWTVLSYGNGPGYVNASARPNLTEEYFGIILIACGMVEVTLNARVCYNQPLLK